MSKNKRHKHADLIHAYAEGAEIEICWGDGWIPDECPVWWEDKDYRIKPEPEPALITEEQRKAILTLWPDARWLAMDEGGSAYVYLKRPTELDSHWNEWDSEDCWEVSALYNYTANWRESLVDLTKPIEEEGE